MFLKIKKGTLRGFHYQDLKKPEFKIISCIKGSIYGDLAVFNPLIVHRSFYPRIQKQTRITYIIRLDDAGDKNHIELGFMRNDLDKKNIFSCPNYKKY